MSYATKLGLALALCVVSGAALAQADCSTVPEAMRARCQEAARIKAACPGLEGEALKTCQQKNANYANMKEDCSKLQGEPRAKCETQNRAMDKSSTCSGKTGVDLQSCIREKAAGEALAK